MFKKLSQLGKAFMLPIAILPAAGLLLGIGGALSNAAAVAAYPWLDQFWLQTILKVMNFAGSAIFSNLALIFTIGLAVGLANGDKGTAGLAGGVSFLVYTATISGLLTLFAPETTIDTGVVGSLVIGGTVAYLHNRYRKTELPQFLGFFGGSRFIPIISSIAAIFLGVIFFWIWPPIQNWIGIAGTAIASMGSFGTFLYGFLLRLTGAVGLHHTIYPLFWYTALGGTEVVDGQVIVGAQNIFFAELASPDHTGMFTYGTRFFAGRFATMMFGLPAACLAMYHCVPKQKRPDVVGIYSSSALTSFLTGITEPIEYMFLFTAPWLYVIHALLDGISFWVADILSIRIGNSFSGGFIDFLLFGILQGEAKTHWLYIIPVGIAWAAVYYVVFRFCITRFHVAIPGTESESDTDDDDNSLTEMKSDFAPQKGNLHDESLLIIEALGGTENIETVDACATRLRVALKDSSKVNKDALKKIGAIGVLDKKDAIQAVFGGKAVLYSSEINDIMGTGN